MCTYSITLCREGQVSLLWELLYFLVKQCIVSFSCSTRIFTIEQGSHQKCFSIKVSLPAHRLRKHRFIFPFQASYIPVPPVVLNTCGRKIYLSSEVLRASYCSYLHHSETGIAWVQCRHPGHCYTKSNENQRGKLTIKLIRCLYQKLPLVWSCRWWQQALLR